MLVLGLQGSPRKKGNTDILLSKFLNQAEAAGAETITVNVPKKNIHPCIGCGNCERKGICSIQDDDMSNDMFSLLRRADAVVVASPIYFYSVTAQMKCLIDRSQTLWSRKYRLKLSDPRSGHRLGFLLSVGATKGANLFEGVQLTAKYFFDAIDAEYAGSITYRRIEERGDIEKLPEVENDVNKMIDQFIRPLVSRKKILFACRENACQSQMAAAFASYMAGDRIDAFSGGSTPAESINPGAVDVMGEKGIDTTFAVPRSIEAAVLQTAPDIIVTMGCGESCPVVPGAKVIDWDLPDPAGESIECMRNVRDKIEKNIKELLDI